jgi:outer membrane protein assembly factor BamE (lipoprotein component of BamABCDE complex)
MIADRKARVLAVLLMVGVAACRQDPPAIASGLTAKTLSRVRPGMSYAQVRSILGPPIAEPSSNDGRRWLVYAQPRIVSLGTESHPLSGTSCSIALENDALATMFVNDTKANRSCTCTTGHCSADWLAECVGSLPSTGATR